MHLKRVTIHPEKYPAQDCYPFDLPVLRHTRSLSFGSPVTLFAGENGAGKSTLLEAISHACGIHIWRDTDVRRHRYNRYEETLHTAFTVEWAGDRVPGSFFGAETFRHFSELLEEWAKNDPGQFDYFGGKSLLTQSHGQSLMSFFRSRYGRPGLYLLDEPEAALSPRSQLEFLEILRRAVASGKAQFIIATHSPIVLSCPGAIIYSFDREPIQQTTYEETEHYKVYRGFLENRDQYLFPGK